MVIGYHIGKSNSSQLLGAALRKAYESRNPSLGLIFHSDRGCPYCSKSFLSKLEQYGMVQSLSRTGKPHDNAVMESFFSSMKRESLYRREYPSETAFARVFQNISSSTTRSDLTEACNIKRPLSLSRRTTKNTLSRDRVQMADFQSFESPFSHFSNQVSHCSGIKKFSKQDIH